MGALSDRFGRRTGLMACSALYAALTVPLFAILGGASAAATAAHSHRLAARLLRCMSIRC